MKIEPPKIYIDNRAYYQVGCKMCQKGEDWNIYSDGEKFIAKCKCGNTIKLTKEGLKNQPEPTIIDIRHVI